MHADDLNTCIGELVSVLCDMKFSCSSFFVNQRFPRTEYQIHASLFKERGVHTSTCKLLSKAFFVDGRETGAEQQEIQTHNSGVRYNLPTSINIHDTVSWCLHYEILRVRVTILHNLLVLLMLRVTILHNLLVLHERELSSSEDLRRRLPAHYKALTTSVSQEAPSERQEL